MKLSIKKLLLSLMIASTLLTSVACGGDTSGTSGTTDTSGTTGTSGTTQTTESTETTSSDPQADPDIIPDPEPDVEMLPEQEIRVVGINIFVGQNDLAVRGALLAELLNPLNLDSFGVSECSGKWEDELEKYFGDRYARIGVDFNGKQSNPTFATYIYYRKDQYVAIDTGVFWTSTTPDTPSKYGPTVDCQRNCNWVLLEDIQTGFRYVHMNTHLDWMDMEVNKIQCQMIANQIKRFEEMGYPVFATGDYNMEEHTASYPVMTAIANDARHIAAKTTDTVTHPEAGTIDYCFVTKESVEVFEFDVLETQTEPIEISDHRGVYVHAKVKSLPKQSLYSATPEFSKDAAVEISTTLLSTSVILKIPQATDAYGSIARSYLLELFDRQGRMIRTETISSGYYLPVHTKELTYPIVLPNADEYYTLRLTPIGLFDNVGVPLVQGFCNETKPIPPASPEPIGDGDIINVKVADGAIRDTSMNAYSYQVLGNVTVTGNSYTFSNKGNLKFEQFKDHYSTLGDGFSIAVGFRTTEDIQTAQHIIGNCHAGGTSISVEKGSIYFQVYFNGSYVKVHVKASENTTYHVVGVYDPTIGLLLYVNGELVAITAVAENATFGIPTEASARYLCIGADSDASGRGEYFFGGAILYAAIYSTPVTAGNVTYLYQNQ